MQAQNISGFSHFAEQSEVPPVIRVTGRRGLMMDEKVLVWEKLRIIAVGRKPRLILSSASWVSNLLAIHIK